MTAYDYHPFIPQPPGSKIAGSTPREHALARMERPRTQDLFATRERLFREPFRGITTGGQVIPDLFSTRPEGAPTPAMIGTVNSLLACMTPKQKKASWFPVNSQQWRRWQNSELYVEDYGLRLDEVGEPLRKSVMAVLRTSMSAHGYELSRDVMKLNRFLGDTVGGPAVLGEWSYIFCLFGIPSANEPWGWQFFGHHLVLNCLVLGAQMVLTPAFWGAEPTLCRPWPFQRHKAVPGRRAGGAEADAVVLRPNSRKSASIVAFDDGRQLAGRTPAFRRQPASRRGVSGQSHRPLWGPQRETACQALQRRRPRWIWSRNTSAYCPKGRVARGSLRSSAICRTRISAGSADMRRKAHFITGWRIRDFSLSRPPRWRVL